MVLVRVPAVRVKVSHRYRMLFFWSFFLKCARIRDYSFGALVVFVEAMPCSGVSWRL